MLSAVLLAGAANEEEEEAGKFRLVKLSGVQDGFGIDLVASHRLPGREMKESTRFLFSVSSVFRVLLTSFCLEKQSSVELQPVRELPAKTNIYVLVTDICLTLMFISDGMQL